MNNNRGIIMRSMLQSGITVLSHARFSLILTIMMVAGMLQAQPEPKVRLLGPVGGETFAPGDTVTIHWTWREDIRKKGDEKDAFQVDFSGDGGTTWQPVTVVRYRPDTMVKWKVPSLSCNDCRIRILQSAGRMEDIPTAFDSLSGPTSSDPTNLVAVEFAHSKPLLAIVSSDSVYLWDFEQRKILWQRSSIFLRKGYGRGPKDIYFSSNDSLLFVSSAQSTSYVEIWDVQSGEHLDSIARDPYYYRPSFAITPDGRLGVLGGHHPGPLLWNWDIATSSLDTLEKHIFGYGVGITPDGATLAVGGFGSIRLYDLATHALTGEIPIDTGYVYAAAIRFSPDANMMAARIDFGADGYAGGTRLIDLTTGKAIANYSYLAQLPLASSLGGERMLEMFKGSYPAIFERTYPYLYTLPYYPQQVSGKYPMVTGGALTNDGTIAAVALISGTTVQTARYSVWLSRIPPLASMLTVAESGSFTITGTLPFVSDRYVGAVQLGRSSEVTIEGFVTNSGTTPVEIEGITLGGAASADFNIVSGEGPYTLAAGTSAALHVVFTPGGLGERVAQVEVKTPQGVVQAVVKGDGVKQISDVALEDGRTADADAGMRMEVWPNPTRGVIDLRWWDQQGGTSVVALYDMLGRLLMQRSLGYHEGGEHSAVYDIGELPPGVYRVEVQCGSQSVGRMVTVVR